MLSERNPRNKNGSPASGKGKVRLEILGEEIVEKTVKPSGNSGRVYLPMIWVGSRVKIIRLN